MPSTTNWFDLPFELKSNILFRIGPPDILENAQKVCTDWYEVCKHPSLWRVIDMYSYSEYVRWPRLTKMSKHAVDRSQGQLVDIVIPRLGTDEVLLYVADRSSQLKRLTMLFSFCDPSIESLAEALKKFPLLEELTVYSIDFSKGAIESAGRYCPLLKTLIVDQEPHGFWNSYVPLNNEIAVAVGENLHELRHLKLINNGISDIGLKVLLDGCCHLESLDLSLCWNIDLKGDVVKRCSEQIKRLTLPYHSRGSTQSDDSDEEYFEELEYTDFMTVDYDNYMAYDYI